MYVKAKDAKKQLGVTSTTLRHWADKGIINIIRAEGGIRLYDVEEFIARKNKDKENSTKKKYIYCRVSSAKQKEDLERQISYLQEKYPEHEIVKEIASGINFKRKGLNKILAETMQGSVKEIVVANRDRLCRIAWEHFKWLFEYYGVNIIVEDKKEYSPEEELNDDLLSIIHVFSCRHYGIRRKYTRTGIKAEETKNITKQ
jgi:putative resolvase